MAAAGGPARSGIRKWEASCVVDIAEARIERRVSAAHPAFRDRRDAGRRLAAFAVFEPDEGALVLALPRGGIPVARPLADALGCELRPVLVRKLPIPTNPEMGFGAVTIDGTVTLNERVLAAFGIDRSVQERVAEQVRREVERRSRAYPGGWPLPAVCDRRVWLVDDGLATGFSMIAAARMIRPHGPASLTLAAPCAPSDSLTRLAEHVDAEWCLFAQDGHPFAVASYYHDFHEMRDDEVYDLLADDGRAGMPPTGGRS
jgi:putative phosphoribosyl transferase